ncbi:MAG: hypothetical protein Kow00109_08550 [Acidobacteriota bacterium]
MSPPDPESDGLLPLSAAGGFGLALLALAGLYYTNVEQSTTGEIVFPALFGSLLVAAAGPARRRLAALAAVTGVTFLADVWLVQRLILRERLWPEAPWVLAGFAALFLLLLALFLRLRKLSGP